MKEHPWGPPIAGAKLESSKVSFYFMTEKNSYIQKFRELYKRKEGKDLTDQEALEHFEKLIVLVEAVYKPISKKFFDDGSCPHCKKSICFKDFKNQLSINEFLISGLCQKCQDKTFK